jgi:hypothetical protein
MYQLNFSQRGLEQLRVPASTDIRETEAGYRFLARIAVPLQRLHGEIQRLGEKEAGEQGPRCKSNGSCASAS